MASADYFVSRAQFGWQVHFDGQDYPYRTQYEAMQAAIDAAYEAGVSGHDGQVLVDGRDGVWSIIWRYGHDQYPPTDYPHR